MRTLSVIAIAALALGLHMGGVFESNSRIYRFHHENVLGTSMELKVLAPSQQDAEKAERAALDEIAREAAILSSYDPSSEFSRWFRTQGAPVRVSPELYENLSLFDTWRARTAGALNPAAQAVSLAWQAAAKQERTPAAAELAAAAAQASLTHWRLDASTRTATHLSGVPLAMNSLVKSYILDRAASAAKACPHIEAVVLNIGGDLVARGAWTESVVVSDPFSDAENAAPAARLAIRNRAVATSGSYRRGFEIRGVHYSHIVDPRTGATAEHVASATVSAPNAVDSGALATAMCVLKPEESARLAAGVPGAEYLLIQKDGRRIASPGWNQLASAAPAPRFWTIPRAYAAAPASWDPNFELQIQFELARIDGIYRRPFVAVWIEDKDKFPVRTLALWFDKDRWLPDLRSWYRAERLRYLAEASDLIPSVTSATRPPGKYTLKWDGKDNQGKPVKPGVYTVSIEAAREHGTYQIIRQQIDFNAVPKHLELPGNVEIASASLDYRKIAGR